MDDTISRQAAIDELKERRKIYCDNTPESFSLLGHSDKSRVDEIDSAIAILVNLPSAEPEKVCIANVTLSEKTLKELVEKAKAEMVQSTLTVIEPERKKGKWKRIRKDFTHYDYECSECYFTSHFNKHNFCPNCGADMRGDENETD